MLSLSISAFFVVFLYYHYTVVVLSHRIAEQPLVGWKPFLQTLLVAAVNFIYFLLCGVAGLGLLKSYALFWMIVYFEERIFLGISKAAARLITLLSVICTLSNILFYYGVFALFMDKPLSYFDSIFFPPDIRKVIALTISYCSTTFALRYYAGEKYTAPLRHLVSSLHQLKFLLFSMVSLYAYLLFQGIIYGDLSGNIFAKLWSLAGCIFVSFGFIFTVRYAVRLSYLYHLDEQNIELQSSLLKQQENLSVLIDAADLDTLTKVRNRRSGDAVLHSWIHEKNPFILCMVDLDSLKYINDTAGHTAGDQYLLTVVDILVRGCRQDRDLLYRYGGDEFLLAYTGMTEQDVTERLEQLADNVLEEGISQKLPMQLSYGIVAFTGRESAEELLQKADLALYQMKSHHKMQTPQLIRS